jgi:MoxR-like ATPase
MSPSAPDADPPGRPLSSPPALFRLQQIGAHLQQQFLAKEEIIRLLLISVLAGEHLLLIGPPGTAKSALVRTLARLLDARYFEYLLTRFSEPNELLGPVDIRAFREGSYRRRTERMLPDAEIVFLDEIFKANSAILNSLLTLLNERKLHIGAERLEVPLLALFAASNEVPSDDSLAALLDRFLLRVRSHNLDSFHFHRLIAVGLGHEQRLILGAAEAAEPPLLAAAELLQLRRQLVSRLTFSEDFLASYKALVVQIRGEGILISDRRVVKLLKLCAASAMLDGREQADEGDLFVLAHSWNSPEQSEILDGIVQPVVQRFFREHPERLHRLPGSAGLPDILAELQQVRARLQAAASLSDVQLFSQLRTLGELRAALANLPSEATRRVLQEIDTLLDGVFTSGRLG